MAAIVRPDSTARPSANQSGVLPRVKAIFVSGHALLRRMTDRASCIRPVVGISSLGMGVSLPAGRATSIERGTDRRMTFSLIGRCPRTGQIGAAVATSSIAVGARVAYCAAGVGAVLTQHRTDPRLGPRGIDLLRSGCSAQQTADALVASSP